MINWEIRIKKWYFNDFIILFYLFDHLLNDDDN